MHHGDWAAAETLFSDALEVSRSDDRAHWGLAEACWNRGQTDEAIAHMTQSVHLSAGDPKLVRRLGRMYLETGKLDLADESSKRALRTELNSAEGWALRGDCLKAAGKPTEALAAYHRALAILPDYPDVQMQAAEIYNARRRYDRALATLDQIQESLGIDAAPSKVDVLQGVAMRHLGRVDQARRCFHRAAAKSPDDPRPKLEMASLEWLLGDNTRATEALSAALAIDPTDPEARSMAKMMNVPMIAIDPKASVPPIIGSGVAQPPRVAGEAAPSTMW